MKASGSGFMSLFIFCAEGKCHCQPPPDPPALLSIALAIAGSLRYENNGIGMKVICAQLLPQQPKKTKMKKKNKTKHVAAKKHVLCRSEQEQSSDADLAGAELDTEMCISARSK